MIGKPNETLTSSNSNGSPRPPKPGIDYAATLELANHFRDVLAQAETPTPSNPKSEIENQKPEIPAPEDVLAHTSPPSNGASDSNQAQLLELLKEFHTLVCS
jgi:hypothetical protein